MNYRAPPEKGNAARAGNPDGEDSKVYKIYTENSSKILPEVQADYRRLIGDIEDIDSPLDHVVKMTLFKDVSGYEAEPLNVSMRDLYDELPHWSASEKARLPLIVGGAFGDVVSSKGSLRHAGNRENVSAIVVDYDAETISVGEAKRRVKEAGVAAVLYTSPSHTEDAPRWRAVFPLSRAHSTADLAALTDRANGFFDGTLAGESWSPVQPFYVGQVRGRQPMKRALVDGDFLDTRPDLPSIPSKHGTTTRHRDKVEDPREKPGIVGAFCHTFDIHEAIDELLTGVYAPAGRDRYRFKAGSSKVGGVAVYDDGQFAYSNHDSDPARGLHNAFDLVRIHRFGRLDEGLDSDTPVTALPSYRAMCKFARTFDAVADELAAEEEAEHEAMLDDYEDLGPLPVEERPKASHLTILSPAECSIAPQRGYVVKGMIAPRDVGVIFGQPGAGKSLIAPFIGYRVAMGEDAFGMKTRPGSALYIASEDETGMRGRVSALRGELGDAPEFGLVGGVSNLFVGSPDFRALMAVVKERKPSLIIVDTLAMAFPGLEENSAESMGKVIASARALTAHGAAVVLVHHSPKAADGTPRGHSILNGSCDFALEVQPKDGSGIVRGRLTKNRNGSCDVDIAFKIAVSTMGVDEDGDPITYARCEPMAYVPTAGPRPTPAEKAALAVLERVRWRTSDGVVRLEDWRAELLDDPGVSAAEKLEDRKRRARDVISSLSRKRLVVVREGRVFDPNAEPDDFDALDGSDLI